jgi:hypothetical protein
MWASRTLVRRAASAALSLGGVALIAEGSPGFGWSALVVGLAMLASGGSSTDGDHA